VRAVESGGGTANVTLNWDRAACYSSWGKKKAKGKRIDKYWGGGYLPGLKEIVVALVSSNTVVGKCSLNSHWEYNGYKQGGISEKGMETF